MSSPFILFAFKRFCVHSSISFYWSETSLKLELCGTKALYIIIKFKYNYNCKISNLNIEGKVVAEREIKDVLNTTFDFTAVKAGIYFVNVSHASGNKTVKFIKQ